MTYVIAAILLLAPGDARRVVEFTSDSLDVVAKNIDEKKAVLVDVRSKEEWQQGYVAGAFFLPIDSLRKHSFDRQRVAKLLPKKKILYTYCLVGMRAKAAAAILEREGYEVRPLKPGYDELIKYGFAVAPPEKKGG